MKKIVLPSMLLVAVLSFTNAQSHFCQELSWSPNGNKIAFSARTENGSFEIYVVNADGSGLMQITNDTTEDSIVTTLAPCVPFGNPV